MIEQQAMSRWRAGSIHLAISALAAAGALTAMLIWPYPWTYFKAAGGSTLLTVLVLVDITIGPLLTLILFRPGKWGLKFDLYMIATLQVLALAYGLWVITSARPIFLVHVGDRFQLVQANEITDETLAEAKYDAFRTRSWSGPRKAVAIMPDDNEARTELLFSALGGADIDKYPKYYQPFEMHLDMIAASAQSCGQLAISKPQHADLIEKTATAYSTSSSQLLCIPVQTSAFVFLTAVTDQKTGELYKILEIDPWPKSEATPSNSRN